MRKLFSLFAALLIGITAINAEDLYLRGGINNWGFSADFKFTDNGDGTFTLDKTFYLAGQFQFADAEWGDVLNFGSDEQATCSEEGVTINLVTKGNKINTNGMSLVKIIVDKNQKKATFFSAASTDAYTIVGPIALVGADWDPEETANDMIDMKDGTYQLVKENVSLAAGEYEYQSVKDHGWMIWDYPSSRNKLIISESDTYTVTFTLAPAIPSLTAQAVKSSELQPAVTEIEIEGDKYVGTELTFAATVSNFSATPMIIYEVKAGEDGYVQAQGGKYTPTATGDYTVKATAVYQPKEGNPEEAFKEVNFTITEPAPTPVSTTYMDENGETKTVDAWEVKDASAAVTWGTAGETTWYVVKGEDVQLSAGAICAGDVRLILADNAKLTATGVQDYSDFTLTPGIEVSGEGNSFIIYAQSTGEQMGQLVAQSNGASGIGGSFSSPNSFNIIINGGKVTATGLDAGIGGGQDGSGTNITINGGIVEATGGSGAGIGGGPSYQWDVNTFGSDITINGGTVTASSERGAGIGGGSQGYASNITINGGTVTTTGGEYSAGIGGSNGGGCINVVINGGTITAIGDESNPAIGGSEATISDIYISDAYNLYGGENKDNTSLIPHSSAQDMADILSDWPQYYEYVKIEGLATPYTRTVTNGQWATICLPYAATSFSGATFYKLNYFDQVDKLYIEPVDNLLAGMPYIFQATADVVTIEHGDATLTYGEEQTEYGLHGSFARTILESDGNLAALSSGTVMIAELAAKVTVPACRAYFDMTEVPTNEQPHSAPLRCISVPSKNPTDLGQSTIHNSRNGAQSTFKVLENGQFRIVRDGKTYNAQGQIIQ